MSFDDGQWGLHKPTVERSNKLTNRPSGFLVGLLQPAISLAALSNRKRRIQLAVA
jgi:hypothetical protein